MKVNLRRPRRGRGSQWRRASTRSSSWSARAQSWEKAAAAAVERASKNLRDLRVAEVVEQDLVIDNGKVEAYRAKLKVSFKYEGKD